MKKRSGLQKAVLISVAVMAVAFAILTFAFHRMKGAEFEGGLLRVSVQADDPAATVYAGTILAFARGAERTARGSWMLYFTMLLFSGLLALDAAYPLALFRWQHMCDVKDPEPSDFYLGMQRAGWCIYPILLFIGYNIALWVLP